MADRRSRVPQRTYATTLEEQLEQLETDPLLQRFQASRQRLSGDPHRPVYHYVNPEGNLNDPNGFCRWQGRYHLFYQAYPPEDIRQHWGHACSDDLVHWSDPVLVFDPDQRDNLDDSHYGFVPWRAGELQLGILNVFHQVDNTMDMYLLFSRDGLAWQRLPQHRPLLPRGGAGSFDEHMIETPTQPIVVGDEIWLYYGGHSVHHDWWICGRREGLEVPEAHDPTLSQNGHHLALATLRLDGWVSLATTLREGWIETKPVSSAGAHLFINGRCRSGGYIEVEVTDHWDNPWPGFSRADCDRFAGDSVRHKVTWAGRSRISELPFAVKLRFHMRDADLYSFQIADTPIPDQGD